MVDKLFTSPLIFSIFSAILGAILWEVLKYLKYLVWNKLFIRKELTSQLNEINEISKSGDYINSLIEYNKLKDRINLKSFPDLFHQVQRGIGLCYLETALKNKQENEFRLAMRALQIAESGFALRSYRLVAGNFLKELKYPLELVKTYILLGVTFQGLAYVRDAENNLNQSIKYFTEAINLCDHMGLQSELSEFYYKSYNNLGISYARLSDVREKNANLIKSIDYLKKSLENCDKEKQSDNYSAVVIHIGNCYLNLSRVSNELMYIKESINLLSEELKRIEKNLDREISIDGSYANVHRALGNSKLKLAYYPGQDMVSTIEESISHYNTALRHTSQDEIYNLSELKNNIALAYRALASVKDKKVNLDIAKSLFEEILPVFNLIDYPLNYAQTIYHLGITNGELSESDDNYDSKKSYSSESIAYFEEVIKIYTKDKFPIKHADACNALATQYSIAAKIADSQLNIQKMIELSDYVLSIITQSDDRFTYSKALLNRGIGYLNKYKHHGQLNDKKIAEDDFNKVITLLDNEKNNLYYEAQKYLGYL